MAVRRHLLLHGKMLLDLAVLGAAFCVAYLIRFEGVLPAHIVGALPVLFPLAVVVKGLCVAATTVRATAWRYVSLAEVVRILAGLIMAAGMLLVWRWAVLHIPSQQAYLRQDAIPIGVLLSDLPLSLLGLVGLRVISRLLSERHEYRRRDGQVPTRVPTLLIGAGHAGALVAREIATRPDSGIQPVGFLDDDPNLLGQVICGLRVLGTTERVEEFVQCYGAQQAIITIANSAEANIRRIARRCLRSGITTKIIPPLHELMAGKSDCLGFREVRGEDVLARPPVCLDATNLRAILRGSRVLVTGAGGSIGSELCREVCRFAPAKLVLVEQAENSLFEIHRRLLQAFPEVEIIPCIADICDESRMRQVLAEQRPSVLFHAAAHKHVPLLEWNPGEAVKNNVLGTAGLARLAHVAHVERFVMISTDKAVNPSSVMGVSKRVAELFIQAFGRQSKTRFMTVRFGNVLGSNGSVLPIFHDQIVRGGPVTVTHPEMERYFMTIPEACQLVLQAMGMGAGGEIFILDMGEPVKIVDLARDLIRMHGLVPDRDVEIHFTGIRPGEKLTEELFSEHESIASTGHPRIVVARTKVPDWDEINRQVREIGELAGKGDPRPVWAKFKEIVPEYQVLVNGQEPATSVRIDPPHVLAVTTSRQRFRDVVERAVPSAV